MTDLLPETHRPARRAPEDLAVSIAASLRPDQRLLVALDHDGTLSPIAPRPQDAVLASGAAEALEALGQVADVVVLSGRGLDDLVDRVGRLPLRIVSEHGLRMRHRDGRVTALTDGFTPEALADVRDRVATLLPADRLAEGWIVEDKGVGLAIHHRLVAGEAVEPMLSTVREVLRAAPGGHVQEGKAVLELRAAGADKGSALAHLIATSGPALPVMVGDDLTDEPALATAEAEGGVGVLVASEDRASAASVRVADPDAVVALLAALAERIRRGR